MVVLGDLMAAPTSIKQGFLEALPSLNSAGTCLSSLPEMIRMAKLLSTKRLIAIVTLIEQ